MTSLLFKLIDIRLEAHLLEDLFDLLLVVTLQLNAALFGRTAGGAFALQFLCQIVHVYVVLIDAFDHGDDLSVTPAVGADPYSLLLTCDLLAHAQFLGQSTYRADFSH